MYRDMVKGSCYAEKIAQTEQWTERAEIIQKNSVAYNVALKLELLQNMLLYHFQYF